MTEEDRINYYQALCNDYKKENRYLNNKVVKLEKEIHILKQEKSLQIKKSVVK